MFATTQVTFASSTENKSYEIKSIASLNKEFIVNPEKSFNIDATKEINFFFTVNPSDMVKKKGGYDFK
jgi:hypothetical protein